MAQTFHLFLSLPKELQMQIWEHAANPEGGAELGRSFLMYTSGYSEGPEELRYRFNLCTENLTFVKFHSSLENRAKNQKVAATRVVLKRTCRLACQVVLEGWKKDVVPVVAEGDDETDDMMWAGKEKINVLIDTLLAELRQNGELAARGIKLELNDWWAGIELL